MYDLTKNEGTLKLRHHERERDDTSLGFENCSHKICPHVL